MESMLDTNGFVNNNDEEKWTMYTITFYNE